MINTGNELKQARERATMSMQQLANALGLTTRGRISQLESKNELSTKEKYAFTYYFEHVLPKFNEIAQNEQNTQTL